jgi:hypothetical protein
MATTKAARRATSVLPKPTSPQIGAQGDLGLAEAHVAADQPVHRLARRQVLQHVADGRQLVVRLLVGEAGAEFVEHPVRRIHRIGGLGGALGGDADQAVGHLAQAFLGASLAGLPGGAAQPVELHALGIGAVAGQEVDVLHRQVELGLAAVVDLQGVVRRTLHVEGLQPLVAADAVVDVHHEVALGQGGGFGQEVGGAPAPLRPRQPVAEDVGLGDDRQAVGLEPGLQRQHHPLRRLRVRRPGGVPVGGEGDALQPVVGEHRAQPVGGALGPGGEQHPLAVAAEGLGVVGGGFEQVDAVALALGREAAPLARAHVDDGLAFHLLERGEPAAGTGGQPRRPLVGGQIELVRRQRVIVDLPLGAGASVVGVGDDRQPLVARLAAQVIHRDQRVLRQEVEEGRHLRIEERQPVLHPGAAAALGDGGVERVVARRAEGLQIAGAEAADGVGVEQRLAHRQQADVLQLPGGALAFRIEGADRFQGVAEQVQADRLLRIGREDVDHAAADGELAVFGHRRGALVAVDGEIGLEVGDLDGVAGAGRIAGALDRAHRRHALHRGRHRGHQQHRRLRVDARGQTGQRRHPLGGDPRRRPDAVVRQAVPGREGHHFDVGGEEGEGLGEGRQPRPVAGDEHRQAFAGPHDVGHHQGVEAFRRADQVQPAGIFRDPPHLRRAHRPRVVSRHGRRLGRRELQSGTA